MDMLKVLKIRSVENAEYTKQQNRMRFKIPADNLNTHLNESYLSFDVQLVDTTTNNLITSDKNLGFGNDNKPYYPTCLLKTVRLFRGDSNIPLEEIQHFNVLDQTIKMYEKDFEDLISDQLEKGFIVKDTFQGSYSQFFKPTTTPTAGVLSINIPLKYIFGLCKSNDFYLSETGGLQIEFELEDNYKLFNEQPVSNPVNAVVASSLLVDEDTVTATSASTLAPAYVNSQSVRQSTFVSPSSGSLYEDTSTWSTGNIVNVSDTDGGVKDVGNTYTASLLTQFRTKYADAILNSYWGTYDATKKVWPLTLPLEVKMNNGSNPKFYIYNGVQYTLNTEVISSTNKNNLIAATTLGRFTPLKLYYKLNQSDRIWLSIDGRFVSSTPYVSSTSPATITIEIPSEDNTNKPLNNSMYHMMIEMCDVIPEQTNDAKHIDLADNTTTGIIDIPPSVGENCYALSSLDAMQKSCTNIIYTEATDTTPPTIQFTNGLSDDFDTDNNAEYDMLLNPLFENIGIPNYTAVVNGSEVSLAQNPFRTINGKSGPVTITLRAKTYNTLVIYDKVNNKPLVGSGWYGQFAGFFKNSTYGSIRFVNLSTENQVEGYGAVPSQNISYKIPRAELVLIQSAKQSTDESPKVYSTWKMEPALIDYATSRWQHQFILEPGVFNACLVMPQQITSDGGQLMISETDKISSYRWSLDNIDNTNRDVLIYGSLHNDKLIDWFKNSNYELKSLSCYDNRSSFGLIPMKIYTAMDNENMYMDNKTHTLQVVLNSIETLEQKNLYLFKQVLKTL